MYGEKNLALCEDGRLYPESPPDDGFRKDEHEADVYGVTLAIPEALAAKEKPRRSMRDAEEES